jgi:hypothetical protein
MSALGQKRTKKPCPRFVRIPPNSRHSAGSASLCGIYKHPSDKVDCVRLCNLAGAKHVVALALCIFLGEASSPDNASLWPLGFELFNAGFQWHIAPPFPVLS